MADYWSPTVIRQPIPIGDMTKLERLLLGLVFEAEPAGDESVYFHARLGPSDLIGLAIADLRTALAASADIASTAATVIAGQLAKAKADETEIEIDLGETSWAFFLQDIVARSPTLHYVTVITSFTCSKMRPDGFGGAATLITADEIKGKSTEDILADFLDEAGIEPTPSANGKQAEGE